jgi:hypothetical protein
MINEQLFSGRRDRHRSKLIFFNREDKGKFPVLPEAFF